jgi:hypothetical protein
LAIRAKENLSEVKGLQPSKAGPYTQVDLLSGADGLRQVAVGFGQVLNGSLYILRCECGEVGSLHLQLPVDSPAYIYHVICNSLSFPVTIEPEDKLIHVPDLLLNVLHYVYTILNWDFFQRD